MARHISLSLFGAAKLAALFTISDFKTIVVPVTSFGLCTAPALTANNLFQTLIWVWIHLLQFCVSNQSLSPLEDSINKPWRPIPAGLISPRSAKVLRWTLLPACICLSYHLHALGPGLTLAAVFYFNNELRCDAHWVSRNICNAIGYGAFNAGAAFVANAGSSIDPNSHMMKAHASCTIIVLFTIHAQDFRDVGGDARSGRTTLPIAMPDGSRYLIFLSMVIISVAVAMFWPLEMPFAISFIAGAIFVGLRFFMRRSHEDDKLTYTFYNIWLFGAHIMLLAS